MRGLRLHVRPLRPDDLAALARFYEREEISPPAALVFPALIGKLLGEIVCHLAFDEAATPGLLEIRHIYVARELRRKRIGRVLVAETAAAARERGLRMIAVSSDCHEALFFSGVGFAFENGRLIKAVDDDRIAKR
ncbi:MAG TPA: GNAT family N-acetyltransferase [Thermoanaerobaculia bacterium]|nr:GNAT family N-acetyltransferase [Thermoanaerobaculia bacterium]